MGPDEVKGEASDAVVRMVVAESKTLDEEEVSREIQSNDEYNMDGIDEDLWQHIEAQLRDVKKPVLGNREWTVLHRAAARGLSEVVGRLLVACPFLIHERCRSHGSALHVAAENGHAAIVTQLLAACPALINEKWFDDTALYYAARNGHAAIVTQLLAVNPSLADAASLHCAANRGHFSIVTQLLAVNPSLIDARNHDDCTVLHFAAREGQTAMVAHLLAVKPSLAEARTSQRQTALHFAAEDGHAEIVAQLLAVNPALADARTDDGWTPLHAAAANGHAAIVTQLLAANPALVNERAEFDGCTALYYASSKATVTLLLAAKASTEPARDDGRTVLHEAVSKGRTEIVSQLLAANPALIDSRTNEGLTALHDAHHDDIMAQLLAARPAWLDAMINDVDSATALLNAVKLGQEEAAIRLLDMHPNNFICEASDDSCGWTVFHFAAYFAREKVMSRLLTAVSGPDLEQVLSRRSTDWHFGFWSDMTAFHLAAMKGHRNIVAQLLDACPSLIDLIDVLNYQSEFSEPTINILLEFKPALAHAVYKWDSTFLHSVVRQECELVSARMQSGNIEFIERVWKTNPDALRAVDCGGETPFHVAVANDYDKAIDLFQWSLTFAEIAKVYSHHEKSVERFKPVMQRQCEELAVELLPGVVDIVFEYLGFCTVKQKLRETKDDETDGGS